MKLAEGKVDIDAIPKIKPLHPTHQARSKKPLPNPPTLPTNGSRLRSPNHRAVFVILSEHSESKDLRLLLLRLQNQPGRCPCTSSPAFLNPSISRSTISASHQTPNSC